MFRLLDQIKIFTSFHLNQLLIFSADTGKGKSTMIPRLLLYYISCTNKRTSRIGCS